MDGLHGRDLRPALGDNMTEIMGVPIIGPGRRTVAAIAAAKRAVAIKEYWQAQGHAVTVWIEKVEGEYRRPEEYTVCSDMVDGLPRSMVGL